MERTYPFVLYNSLQLSAAGASIWKRNQRVRIRLFNFPPIWPKRGFLPDLKKTSSEKLMIHTESDLSVGAMIIHYRTKKLVYLSRKLLSSILQ